MIPPLGTQLNLEEVLGSIPSEALFSLVVIFSYVSIAGRHSCSLWPTLSLQSVLFLLRQYHGFRGTVEPARQVVTNFQWLEEQKSRYQSSSSGRTDALRMWCALCSYKQSFSELYNLSRCP